MDVNLELYKTFYYIVKEGNITRAAERLYVSQSAVTQSLKKLEEQLGGKLFVRNKNGVVLTSEGEKLFNYIEGSINTLGNASNLFSQYLNNDIGTIRVACGSVIGKIILDNVIKGFSEKYPNIKIEMMNMKTSEGVSKILKDEIDVSFLEGNVRSENTVDVIPLTKFKFCFFTTKEYLKKIGKFNKDKINEYKFVFPKKNTRRYEILNKRLLECGLEIEPMYQFSSANMIASIVEKGIGIGYINELAIKDKLKDGTFVKVNIGMKDIEDELAAVIKDKNTVSNVTLKFIDEVKANF